MRANRTRWPSCHSRFLIPETRCVAGPSPHASRRGACGGGDSPNSRATTCCVGSCGRGPHWGRKNLWPTGVVKEWRTRAPSTHGRAGGGLRQLGRQGNRVLDPWPDLSDWGWGWGGGGSARLWAPRSPVCRRPRMGPGRNSFEFGPRARRWSGSANLAEGMRMGRMRGGSGVGGSHWPSASGHQPHLAEGASV